ILIGHGETRSLPAAQVPPEWPRLLLVIARIVLIPVVAIARLIAWCEEKFSPHRPDASEVPRRATPKLQMDPRPPRGRWANRELGSQLPQWHNLSSVDGCSEGNWLSTAALVQEITATQDSDTANR